MTLPPDLQWRTSTLSQNGGACVAWVHDPSSRLILVRHSREPDGPQLRFTELEWRAFIQGVKRGEADLESTSTQEQEIGES